MVATAARKEEGIPLMLWTGAASLITAAWNKLRNLDVLQKEVYGLKSYALIIRQNVSVGACVRNSYVLVTRQQPSAWPLLSSMKALSLHMVKPAKRRKPHVEVALTKGLQSAQNQGLGLPAPRRAVRRKVPCGGEHEERCAALMASPAAGSTEQIVSHGHPHEKKHWELHSQPRITLFVTLQLLCFSQR